MNRTRLLVKFTFGLAVLLAFSSAAFAQTGEVARKAKPKSNLPFDPHDLSGIWSGTGAIEA